MEIDIRLAGVQLGPYSEKQVREYIDEGLLSGADPAKIHGTENWITVDEMLGGLGGASGTPTEAASETDSTPASEPRADEGTPEAATEEDSAPAPEEPEAPKRAPNPAMGVTHFGRQKGETGKVSLSPVVEALSKKTILIGPTAPSVPSSGSSGRTGYSVMTTSPLTQTPQGTKKIARTAVKALVAQTAPLPTKTISPISKIPPTKMPPVNPATPASQGVTSGPTQQAEDKKPRQSLLKSLTAKTVPMRTSAAPALPPGVSSGTMPVTTPLPTKTSMRPPTGFVRPPTGGVTRPPSGGVPRPPSGTIPPPSVVDDISKRLGQVVQPDSARSTSPKEPAPPKNVAAKTDAVKTDAAKTDTIPKDGPYVETVKIALNKMKGADNGPAESEPAPEKVKKPRRKPNLIGLIYMTGLLVAALLYYIWSPYHAASMLRNALNGGNQADLDNTIDFKSVQTSLKDQVKAQLSQGKGAGTPAMADAEAMLDKSIDLFVTSKGISGLVSKSGTFKEEDLAPTISFDRASGIFLNFIGQPVQSQGLSSVSNFVIRMESALFHLRLEGVDWKLKQVDLAPDLLNPSSPNGVSPLVTPVVQTYMDHGDAKVKKNDLPGAITDYTEAVAIDPNSNFAYNARATAKQAKGDLDGAMKDYSQALTIDPQMAVAYEGRGNVKASKNDIDGAIADFTQAVHFDPALAIAYDGRGNAKTAKEDMEGAIADFSQAITIDPTLASAFSDRGFARQANGNLDGAILDYTQALALQPKTAMTYYHRGMARQSQGNLEAAIVDFDRALAFDPKIAGAYFDRGVAKNATHDPDGAIADYTQAITLNPKNALAYCYRGVVRQAKGDLDGALTDYSQALSLDPKIAIAYYNRGAIKQLKNDSDGAIADSTQALDLDPKNTLAYFNRGFAKLTIGNLDGAQEDLKMFCDSSPRDHDADHARLYLWLIAKGQNSKIDADQDLSDALENNWNATPDDLVSKTAGFLLGRIAETDYLADAASPDAKKDAGQHCEAWYFAGMKRLLMGDRVTAADYFRKSVATQQSNYCEYLLSQAELKSLATAPAPAVQTTPPQAAPPLAPPVAPPVAAPVKTP